MLPHPAIDKPNKAINVVANTLHEPLLDRAKSDPIDSHVLAVREVLVHRLLQLTALVEALLDVVDILVVQLNLPQLMHEVVCVGQMLYFLELGQVLIQRNGAYGQFGNHALVEVPDPHILLDIGTWKLIGVWYHRFLFRQCRGLDVNLQLARREELGKH